MSSLKIKIPPKSTTEQPTKLTTRKSAKRRITSDDESDNADSPSAGPSSANPPLKKPRLSHAENSGAEDGTPRQPHKVTSKPCGSVAVNPKSNLKKRTRILSDDDDFLPEPEVKPTVVASRPKTRNPKGKTEPSGLRESTTKGEVKLATSPSSGPTNKKRPREEENSEVDITTVTNPTTAKPPTSSVPAPDPDGPPPKKKKFPTIKKKPKTDSATGSTLASPALVSSAKSSANPSANPIKSNAGTGTPKPQSPAAVGLPKKLQGPVKATTTNPSGTGDFDLRDSNTWQSLMGKGTSNSGPRVGVEKRVSTEERRKQLDKMRDEARAKREEQAKDTFDLQAQSRKIAAFEMKLAHKHEVKINGPHILGAAFKARPPKCRPAK